MDTKLEDVLEYEITLKEVEVLISKILEMRPLYNTVMAVMVHNGKIKKAWDSDDRLTFKDLFCFLECG
jgi:hypothetical protein